MTRAVLALLAFAVFVAHPAAQVRLMDDSDRAAFRAWFVFLADAQFYRSTPDVIDCAALVRYAFREALRPHTPEWRRLAARPLAPAFPDVRRRPGTDRDAWALFQVSSGRAREFAEFADARTIVRFNTRLVSRDAAAARPGDLFYFHQSEQDSPDHLMVFVGGSLFEREGRDWIVYHTGPQGPTGTGQAAGEVRKVRLADLVRHPAPRWRPLITNPAFVGVFRLAVLDAAS